MDIGHGNVQGPDLHMENGPQLQQEQPPRPAGIPQGIQHSEGQAAGGFRLKCTSDKGADRWAGQIRLCSSRSEHPDVRMLREAVDGNLGRLYGVQYIAPDCGAVDADTPMQVLCIAGQPLEALQDLWKALWLHCVFLIIVLLLYPPGTRLQNCIVVQNTRKGPQGCLPC